MKIAALMLVCLLAGCASAPPTAWTLDAANVDRPGVLTLHRRADNTNVVTLPNERVKRLLDMRDSLARLTGHSPYFVVLDSKEVNAFADAGNGKPTVGITLGMLALFGDDVDAYAAIMGHEFAHLVLGHAAAGKAREQTRQAGSTLVGIVLAIAKVPMGDTIADLGSTAIATVYSRDDERDADKYGMDYMRKAGYDPQGAVRAWEKMSAAGGFNIPFLSSHPQSAERLETMKRLATQ